MNPYQVRYLGVETDAHGMRPESLAELLSKWTPEDVRNAKTGVPKVRNKDLFFKNVSCPLNILNFVRYLCK